MYIVLVTLANSDKTWRIFSTLEEAKLYANIWNKLNESAKIYKANPEIIYSV